MFADSSAVVTHYAPTEVDVLPGAASLLVSALARVEVVAALWQKVAAGTLAAGDAGLLVREFEADWNGSALEEPRYRYVELRTRVLVRAAALSGTHRLRSLDALQLACAVAARLAEPECRTMVVLDERLRGAAAREGFDLLPA